MQPTHDEGEASASPFVTGIPTPFRSAPNAPSWHTVPAAYTPDMQIFAAVLVFVGCGLILGIGLLRGRCLRGTCGGESVRMRGLTLGCGHCPKRDAAAESGEADENAAFDADAETSSQADRR